MGIRELSTEDKLKMLHRVVTNNYNDIDSLLESYLYMGAELLGLEVAIASHIIGDQYTVTAVAPNAFGIEAGAEFELQNTYCREVITKRKTVSVIEAGKEEPFKSHPVYENLKLESYISAPVFVNEKIFGTLNFSSQKKRDEDFSELDYEILELMSESVGRFIENKLVRDALEKHKEAARINSQLSSIGVLAGGMAHELNNPLAILKLCIDRLEKWDQEITENNPSIGKSFGKTLRMSQTQISRIKEIVHKLTLFSGNNILRTNQNLDIKECITSLVDSFKGQSDTKFIDFNLKIDDIDDIYIDRTALTQVLISLIQNSIDAIDESQEDPKVSVIVTDLGEGWSLEIEDNGHGIPGNHKDRIFDPFYTLSDKNENQGLGLSTAKGILDTIGGSIQVTSVANPTRFKITLPKAKTSTKMAA